MKNQVVLFFFFSGRARFVFNLAALKTATQAAKLDLGEFYTSQNVNDSTRFFLNCYGAWRRGKEYTEKSLRRFEKLWKRLTVSDIDKLRNSYIASNVISERLRDAAKKISKKKTQ